MNATPPKALVIGVGALQGLGASLCLRFAREGHHVYAAGRTRATLDRVVEAIEAAGGRASAVATDATRESDVIALFDAVAQAPGSLDLAVYNVGNSFPGRVLELDASTFEQAWRTCCFGGFLFGREAGRRMLPGGGTLIFTGASASLRGRAGFGAFNAGKGALRNLAQAMAKEFGPEGLHVAHVIIDGGIAGDRLIKARPELARSMGEARLIELDGIVDSYWHLHRQPRRAWTFELDLRTSQEPW
jgi:NAD(P)-dependent dehydrogenase (short-subunit alcohol dehydrogenase family)